MVLWLSFRPEPFVCVHLAPWTSHLFQEIILSKMIPSLRVWALSQQSHVIQTQRAGWGHTDVSTCLWAWLLWKPTRTNRWTVLWEHFVSELHIAHQAARSEDEALAPFLVPRPLWLSPMTTKNFSLGFGRPGFQMSWGKGLRSVFIRSEGMGLDSLVVSSPWVLCDFCAPVLHLGLESSNAKGIIWDVHLGAVNPVDSCAFYLEKWGQLLPKLKAALRFPYLDSVGKW